MRLENFKRNLIGCAIVVSAATLPISLAAQSKDKGETKAPQDTTELSRSTPGELLALSLGFVDGNFYAEGMTNVLPGDSHVFLRAGYRLTGQKIGAAIDIDFADYEAHSEVARRSSTAYAGLSIGQKFELNSSRDNSYFYAGAEGRANIYPGSFENPLEYADYNLGALAALSIGIPLSNGNQGNGITSLALRVAADASCYTKESGGLTRYFRDNLGLATNREVNPRFQLYIGVNFRLAAF